MSDLLKIEGMQEVIREIQKIDSDVVKRREILKVLRRQSKPLVNAIRSKTPIAKYSVVRRLKSGEIAAEYKPENLKKSIKIKTSRNKKYPNVLVGPNFGRGKYDGYYAFFIQYGTSTQSPNDFIWKAAKPLMSSLNTTMSVELKKYIEKQIKSKINI